MTSHSSDIAHGWKPKRPVARVLDAAPDEAVGPAERLVPLRKTPGFVPAVRRWSYRVPPDQAEIRVAYFGAVAPTEAALALHPLLDWVRDRVVGHPSGPTCVEHARFPSADGVTHSICAYWIDEDRFRTWREDRAVEAWWQAPERLAGELGTWREILRIPRDRQESLYWLDFPKGLSTSPEIELYPTPYCGYYGSMRDRLMASCRDRLEADPAASLSRRSGRHGYGEHWSVEAPGNITLICGGSSWGFMGLEQHADYEGKLREPVTNGMAYLAENALPSGCLSMRWQRSTDTEGTPEPDEHAHAYFFSLPHLENWSEHHGSHAAIFSAAIQRYRKYGSANQLRTWHEVFVLPAGGQLFEYLNCHPDTGLLSWFDARLLRSASAQAA